VPAGTGGGGVRRAGKGGSRGGKAVHEGSDHRGMLACALRGDGGGDQDGGGDGEIRKLHRRGRGRAGLTRQITPPNRVGEPSRQAQDQVLADRLWELSEKLLRERLA